MKESLKTRKLNYEDSVRWLPFIGANYHISPYKILLIGESHYLKPSDPNDLSNNPKFTRLIVKELGIEKMNYGNIKLFNRINILINYANNEAVWNEIAFYNFIQEVMPDNNVRPGKDNYINGWKCLTSVLVSLKPDLCIFIGTEASNTIHQALMGLESFIVSNLVHGEKLNGTYLRTATLQYENMCTKLIFIKHLSKFASVSKWRDKILEFAPEAKEIIKS